MRIKFPTPLDSIAKRLCWLCHVDFQKANCIRPVGAVGTGSREANAVTVSDICFPQKFSGRDPINVGLEDLFKDFVRGQRSTS